MPTKVYNNVVRHRVLDNGVVCEDITSVELPTISHPTTTISASGMAGDVDMPDSTRIEAMDFSVAHNNGANCRYLGNPGKHMIEVRIARQRYDVAPGEINHESVKYRITCAHKSTEKGKVETGNPLGSTDKYSVLRFEEEIDGEITTIVDVTSGVLRFNGVDCADEVESLLE